MQIGVLFLLLLKIACYSSTLIDKYVGIYQKRGIDVEHHGKGKCKQTSLDKVRKQNVTNSCVEQENYWYHYYRPAETYKPTIYVSVDS
jgi:hypothetical protein